MLHSATKSLSAATMFVSIAACPKRASMNLRANNEHVDRRRVISWVVMGRA
jgi:hypothetical protein